MCEFNIPFSGTAETLMSRAKQEIERAGGSFTGNDEQGNFQAKTPLGSIYGTYQVVQQEIALKIIKKPLLVSCKRIQKELNEVMR